MSTDDGLSQLQRDTIAAKAHAAAAKATRANIDVRIREGTAAVEEAGLERKAISAAIGRGEAVSDEALTAAVHKVETAKERVVALREAVEPAQTAMVVANRALRVLLATELRLRLAAVIRRRAWLQEENETNEGRFTAIKYALDLNEPAFLEEALAKYPLLPEPEPEPALAVAAE